MWADPFPVVSPSHNLIAHHPPCTCIEIHTPAVGHGLFLLKKIRKPHNGKQALNKHSKETACPANYQMSRQVPEDPGSAKEKLVPIKL